MATLAREVGGKGRSLSTLDSLHDLELTTLASHADSAPSAASAFVYKSRTRNEPTTATMPQWAAVLWARLESLIADMGSICIKVSSSRSFLGD